MKHILMILVIYFAMVLFVDAQSNDVSFPVDDEWHYQENCPTQNVIVSNENDWRGTIIMRGHFGIHGFNAKWETPRVMSFSQSNREHISSSISPDANWYVTVYGSGSCSTQSCTGIYNFAGLIQIHAITHTDPHTVYNLNWSNSELSHHTRYNVSRPTWIDNTHFIYHKVDPAFDDGSGIAVVDTMTGNISEWTSWQIKNVFPINPTRVSPDLQWQVTYEFDNDTDESWIVIQSSKTDEIYRRFATSGMSLLDESTQGLWSPTSDYLLLEQSIDNETDLTQLILYNIAEDRMIPVISAHELSFLVSNFSGFLGYLNWSPSGKYFLTELLKLTENENGRAIQSAGLHLVDIDNRHITNLCQLRARSDITWSQDSTQVAGVYDNQLVIYDIATNQWIQYTDTFLNDYSVVAWQSD